MNGQGQFALVRPRRGGLRFRGCRQIERARHHGRERVVGQQRLAKTAEHQGCDCNPHRTIPHAQRRGFRYASYHPRWVRSGPSQPRQQQQAAAEDMALAPASQGPLAVAQRRTPACWESALSFTLCRTTRRAQQRSRDATAGWIRHFTSSTTDPRSHTYQLFAEGQPHSAFQNHHPSPRPCQMPHRYVMMARGSMMVVLVLLTATPKKMTATAATHC